MVVTDALADTMTGGAPSASCMPGGFREAVLAVAARAKPPCPQRSVGLIPLPRWCWLGRSSCSRRAGRPGWAGRPTVAPRMWSMGSASAPILPPRRGTFVRIASRMGLPSGWHAGPGAPDGPSGSGDREPADALDVAPGATGGGSPRHGRRRTHGDGPLPRRRRSLRSMSN